MNWIPFNYVRHALIINHILEYICQISLFTTYVFMQCISSKTVSRTTLDGLTNSMALPLITWTDGIIPNLCLFRTPGITLSSVMDDHVVHSFQKLYRSIHLSKMIPNGTKLDMHYNACIFLRCLCSRDWAYIVSCPQNDFIAKSQYMEITFVHVYSRFTRTGTKYHR